MSSILTAPFLLQQLTDNSGKPLSNGKLYSYVGGSTNLSKAIYYDKDYTNPCPNPLPCDASGVLPQYFLQTGYYKFEVRASDNTLIATRDWISGEGTSSEGDHKVLNSSNDTTAAYLGNKVAPGQGIYIQTIDPNTNEQLEINCEGKFGINASDTTIGYFGSKVVSSPTVDWQVSDLGGSSLATQPNVNISAVQTYKIKTDGSDTQPTFLFDKLENSSTVSWSLDTNADGHGFHAIKANVVGSFPGDIGTSGQCATLPIASADQTIVPSVIGTYSELIVRFSPYVDQNISFSNSVFNTYLIQGSTNGNLRFTLRDSSGFLIGYSTLITNPSNNSFLSQNFSTLQLPGSSPSPLSNYKLLCSKYYYIGILFNTNDFNFPGTLIQQNFNIQPWVAGKFDNLTSIPENQLTAGMGSESKLRIFSEIIGG